MPGFLHDRAIEPRGRTVLFDTLDPWHPPSSPSPRPHRSSPSSRACSNAPRAGVSCSCPSPSPAHSARCASICPPPQRLPRSRASRPRSSVWPAKSRERMPWLSSSIPTTTSRARQPCRTGRSSTPPSPGRTSAGSAWSTPSSSARTGGTATCPPRRRRRIRSPRSPRRRRASPGPVSSPISSPRPNCRGSIPLSREACSQRSAESSACSTARTIVARSPGANVPPRPIRPPQRWRIRPSCSKTRWRPRRLSWTPRNSPPSPSASTAPRCATWLSCSGRPTSPPATPLFTPRPRIAAGRRSRGSRAADVGRRGSPRPRPSSPRARTLPVRGRGPPP